MKKAFPFFRKIFGNLDEVIGIADPRVKSPESLRSPEGYIFDFLGMIGIPVKPVAGKITGGEPIELVTIHAGDIKQNKISKQKKRFIVTSEAVSKIVKSGESRMLGLSEKNPIQSRMIMADYFENVEGVIFGTGTGHDCSSPVPVGPILNPLEAEPLLFAVEKGKKYPVVLKRIYNQSEIFIFCLTRFPLYLKRYYPEITRQMLRDIIGQSLGIKIRYLNNEYAHLPAVGLFPYKNTIVLLNFERCVVKLDLLVNPKITGKHIITRRKIRVEEPWEIVSVTLVPEGVETVGIGKDFGNGTL